MSGEQQPLCGPAELAARLLEGRETGRDHHPETHGAISDDDVLHLVKRSYFMSHGSLGHPRIALEGQAETTSEPAEGGGSNCVGRRDKLLVKMRDTPGDSASVRSMPCYVKRGSCFLTSGVAIAPTIELMGVSSRS